VLRDQLCSPLDPSLSLRILDSFIQVGITRIRVHPNMPFSVPQHRPPSVPHRRVHCRQKKRDERHRSGTPAGLFNRRAATDRLLLGLDVEVGKPVKYRGELAVQVVSSLRTGTRGRMDVVVVVSVVHMASLRMAIGRGRGGGIPLRFLRLLRLLLLLLLLLLIRLVPVLSGSARNPSLHTLSDRPPDLIQHPHHNEDPEHRLPGRRKKVQQHRCPKQQQKQRQ
jgi:hypothetical protein